MAVLMLFSDQLFTKKKNLSIEVKIILKSFLFVFLFLFQDSLNFVPISIAPVKGGERDAQLLRE